MEIDLNCDLGEGCVNDAELMSMITSANIACGFHAGDPATAFATLSLAARHGVQAGRIRAFRIGNILAGANCHALRTRSMRIVSISLAHWRAWPARWAGRSAT